MFCNYLSRTIKKQISIRINNAKDISDWCRRKVKINISIFRRIVATVIYGGFQFELWKFFNVGGVIACFPRKPTNFLRCNIARGMDSSIPISRICNTIVSIAFLCNGLCEPQDIILVNQNGIHKETGFYSCTFIKA